MTQDLVNHPPHYADGWSNGAEVIDITENLNFNRGNAVKYIARAGKKDPETELEDLKKAEFYLKREIARITLAGWTDICYIEDGPPADETPKPRQWDSLYRTPWDVQVRDAEGDLFKYDEDKGWLFKIGRCWVNVGDSKSFDNYGPFVEILEPKKPEPRVWASLGDIPEGVRFVDKDGEDDWVPEPGATAYDEYGPFTEILDD